MSKINIQVSRDTHKELEELGRKNETFDQIVSKAAQALHNERIYNEYYFHYRSTISLNLQYGQVRLPKREKNQKITINIEEVVEAIYTICEENNVNVEIIGSHIGKPEDDRF